MARQGSGKPAPTAPAAAPVSLTRQADEQVLQDIRQEIGRWLFAYVKMARCVDLEDHVGQVLEPMTDEQARAFVAANFRELWDTVLPERLKQAYAEVQARLGVGSNAAAGEEWLPANKAVERAEHRGHAITLKWVTQDAGKHGVRTRPRQLPGRHRVEVEWNSLAGYLLRPTGSEEEPGGESDEEAMSSRLRDEAERMRRERPLD